MGTRLPDTRVVFFFNLYFCVYSSFATCMFVQHMHAYCPQRLEEGVGSPKTGFTENCEPLCGC